MKLLLHQLLFDFCFLSVKQPCKTTRDQAYELLARKKLYIFLSSFLSIFEPFNLVKMARNKKRGKQLDLEKL